jgi:hypothetical protein
VPLTTEGTYYENEGFREIPIYPEFKKLEDGTERSIIHVKQYAAGYFYFGLPEWIGAKMWAEMEYRIQSDLIQASLKMALCLRVFYNSLAQ